MASDVVENVRVASYIYHNGTLVCRRCYDGRELYMRVHHSDHPHGEEPCDVCMDAAQGEVRDEQ